eukprot:scaffold15149_cov106-Isochrysis_galbana.AAC.4
MTVRQKGHVLFPAGFCRKCVWRHPAQKVWPHGKRSMGWCALPDISSKQIGHVLVAMWPSRKRSTWPPTSPFCIASAVSLRTSTCAAGETGAMGRPHASRRTRLGSSNAGAASALGQNPGDDGLPEDVRGAPAGVG